MGEYRIDVDPAELADLHQRLERTRWPDTLPDTGWADGADLGFVKQVCDDWRHHDWAATQDRLNELPHHLVDLGDARIHCIHVRGVGPDPVPLVLTHGWPSSFVEMLDVIGPLTDPAAHGGDPADAFHVVVPSLPGYGFSPAPSEPGTDAGRIADLWVALMAHFGYERFGAQGGDWGSAVTTALGARHPDHLLGIHLNMLAPPVDPDALTAEQRRWWDELARYRDEEWGYVHLQRTKPHTPAFALTDSPAGLAAWILEKWWRWSDCEGPDGRRDLWLRFTPDQVFTNLTVYWVTRSIGPSLRLYRETFGSGSLITQPPRITVPTGVALFNEPNRAPRDLVEPWYDLRRYTTIDDGGHFPGMENPAALVDEVRAFFRELRDNGGNARS